MDTMIVVSEEGMQFAQQNADELRQELKAAIDTMPPADLLLLWAQIGDQKPIPHTHERIE